MEHIATKLNVPKKETKHQWEYQELCTELQPIYGSGIWRLPHLPGFTEHKIRNAAQIAKNRGKENLAYLIGIIKKLP